MRGRNFSSTRTSSAKEPAGNFTFIFPSLEANTASLSVETSATIFSVLISADAGAGAPVGAGDGNGDGVGVAAAVADGDGEGDGAAVAVGVGAAFAAPVADGDGEGVAAAVGVSEGDSDGDGVKVGLPVGDGDGVAAGLTAGDGGAVAPGEGAGTAMPPAAGGDWGPERRPKSARLKTGDPTSNTGARAAATFEAGIEGALSPGAGAGRTSKNTRNRFRDARRTLVKTGPAITTPLTVVFGPRVLAIGR